MAESIDDLRRDYRVNDQNEKEVIRRWRHFRVPPFPAVRVQNAREAVAYWIGFRRGELLKLGWRQVDLENRRGPLGHRRHQERARSRGVPSHPRPSTRCSPGASARASSSMSSRPWSPACSTATACRASVPPAIVERLDDTLSQFVDRALQRCDAVALWCKDSEGTADQEHSTGDLLARRCQEEPDAKKCGDSFSKVAAALSSDQSHVLAEAYGFTRITLSNTSSTPIAGVAVEVTGARWTVAYPEHGDATTVEGTRAEVGNLSPKGSAQVIAWWWGPADPFSYVVRVWDSTSAGTVEYEARVPSWLANPVWDTLGLVEHSRLSRPSSSGRRFSSRQYVGGRPALL
jgi:hypothetical protein